MGYPYNQLEVRVEGDKVTLVTEQQNADGYRRQRRQLSFTRRQFEKALENDEITIPWKDVIR